MTETRTTACPLDCPDACSLEGRVEGGRVTALDGDTRNPVTDGFLCGKVRGYARHVYHPERVREPLLRDGARGAGRWRSISWDEAFARISTELDEARTRFGPTSILPVAYGGSNGVVTHGALDERFFRRLGASQLDHTICAAATGAAATGLYGRMPAGTYGDVDHAELIVVWGANPAASGIHLMPHLDRARKRGARLVVVDPRRTKVAKRADLHLAPLPGTDLPLALALVRWMFATGRADEAFLSAHATGVDELRVRAEPWTLERAAEVCGVEARAIETLGRWYTEASPALLRCGWGLERNRNGGSAVCAVLSLPAVAGTFGQRGGGFLLSNSPHWDPLHDASGDAVGSEDEPAWTTRTINMNRLGRALCGELDLDPPLAFLFVYDANPLATFPDQERVRRGFEREDLFVVVHEQVMTDTARIADLVLPATTFLEHHELRAGYGATPLQWATPVIEPVGEARSNDQLFAELLERTGLARAGDAVTPRELFANATRGLGVDQALLSEGIAWPTVREPVAFVDVFPQTSDGKIHLVPEELDREAGGKLYHFQELAGDQALAGAVHEPAGTEEDARLALLSPATSRTISSSLGELVEGQVPLRMHPADASRRGLSDRDSVRIWNELGEVRTEVRLDADLRPGVVELPKGLWARHTQNGRTANALSPDTLTDVAGGACFNDARVFVERCKS